MSSKWTVETIYREKITDREKLKNRNPFPPRFPRYHLDMLKDEKWKDHPYDPAFVADVISEKEWIPARPPQVPAAEDLPLIERKEMVCPLCHGTGSYWQPHKGGTTQIEAMFQKTCTCTFWIARWSIWGDTNIVPLIFRDVTYNGLSPSEKSKMSMPSQEMNIAVLKAHPDHNFLIHGEAGTGKTHYSIALMDRAVRKWAQKLLTEEEGAVSDRIVFRVDTKTWCDEMLAWDTKKFGDEETTMPHLNVTLVRKLADRGVRLFVIFDELDKMPSSEGRLLNLFQITNALTECGAQMIATSNHSPEQLKAKWKSEHTEPILRRFMDGTGGFPRIELPLKAEKKKKTPAKNEEKSTGKK
jgi:hypothetical protein